MRVHDVDGLNAGFAEGLLEEYLGNPDAVPAEWRAHFESAADDLLESHPGLRRLLDALQEQGNGHAAVAPVPAPAPAPAPALDAALLGGIAAAMALVKAFRMHGHLAARLDPLGSEPVGDPALEPERLVPKLTAGLQAGGRAAAPAGDLLRDDRLRDRAHLRPRAPRLAPAGDRGGPLPAPADA